MTISSDLMLAILSLDSYNRGYGAGISDSQGTDPDGLGESGFVGNARILARSNDVDYQAWEAAGFYAIAYEVPGVGTVISYRGTDNFNPFSGDSDVTNGWISGAGFWDSPQAKLAFEFYNGVREQVGPDARKQHAQRFPPVGIFQLTAPVIADVTSAIQSAALDVRCPGFRT